MSNTNKIFESFGHTKESFEQEIIRLKKNGFSVIKITDSQDNCYSFFPCFKNMQANLDFETEIDAWIFIFENEMWDFSEF